MKFLTLIVLMISLAATFVPCCEYDDCQNETTTASQTDNREQKGTCSPLSTCPACGGSILVSRLVQVSQPEDPKKELFVIEASSLPFAHVSSFWQPPRLS